MKITVYKRRLLAYGLFVKTKEVCMINVTLGAVLGAVLGLLLAAWLGG